MAQRETDERDGRDCQKISTLHVKYRVLALEFGHVRQEYSWTVSFSFAQDTVSTATNPKKQSNKTEKLENRDRHTGRRQALLQQECCGTATRTPEQGCGLGSEAGQRGRLRTASTPQQIGGAPEEKPDWCLYEKAGQGCAVPVTFEIRYAFLTSPTISSPGS